MFTGERIARGRTPPIHKKGLRLGEKIFSPGAAYMAKVRRKKKRKE
jgi:hypothetical protein